MAERFTRTEHKGKIINYFDYRGLSSLNEDEFIKTVYDATDWFMKWGDEQLTLTDMREAYTNQNIMKVW